MMNKSMSLRSEEARRQAHAATVKARQAQSEALKERAELLAVKAEKIDNLRAQRLAREAAAREAAAIEAATPKPATPRKRSTAKPKAAGVGREIGSDAESQA